MDIKEFDNQLHDAEVKMKRLKALYEQWFQGIEKMEPLIPKKDLERQLMLLRREKPRNTAARFRFQQLQARYNTYLTYWGRISRQIEEGTYARDLRRARRRRGPAARVSERAPVKAFEVDLDQEIDISVSDLEVDNDIDAAINALQARESHPPAARKPALSAFSPFALGGDAKRKPKPPEGVKPAAVQGTFGRPVSKRPAAPKVSRPQPKSPAARPPARRAAATPGPARGDMGKLYDDYVAARARNNQGPVQRDKLEKSVKAMRSKLKKKHGDKKIDFEVVVKDGRVGLKPKIG